MNFFLYGNVFDKLQYKYKVIIITPKFTTFKTIIKMFFYIYE